MSTSWRESPLNVIRGGLMGAAEVVPGVSGGTVALVTGVYDRLIDAAGDLLSAVRLLITSPAKGAAALRRVDWAVVVPVLAGMAVALLVAARVLQPLLESYPRHCYAVFFGMILASIAVPFRMIEGPRPRDYVLIAVAAIATAFLTGLPPGNIDDPPLWLILIVAAVVINALVLPGVSGSLVMLVIGVYAPTIAAVNGRDFAYLTVFAVGALIGLSCFVKGLQWLLHHRHKATLAVMTGLLIGSLRALWPWQDDERNFTAIAGDVLGIIALGVAGFALVIAIVIVESRLAGRSGRRGDPAHRRAGR